MSRAINLRMEEGEIVARCLKEKVGVSAIERLPAGGTRLVCMSVDGAELIRRKLKTHIIAGEVKRERFRPARPLW
jgi:hypothetical protein